MATLWQERQVEDLQGTVERLTAQIREYEKEIAEIREKEGPVEIRGYLPRLTPYQKAVAKLHGTAGLSRIYPTSGNRYNRAHENQPFGGSWHKVKGQGRYSLGAKIKREHRKWLKKVDQSCLENPSPTFKVNLDKECLTTPECRVRKQPNGKVAEDVAVELQLLGVEVVL